MWDFWQFTATLDGKALDPNGNAELDGNYFGGTASEFAARYGGEVTPPPPAQEQPMKQAVIKNTTSLKVRSGPAVTYVQIGGLYVGDVAYGETDPSGWFHLSSIKRASGETVTLNGWASMAYLTVTDYVPPVAPSVDYVTAHFTDGTTKKYIPE